MNEYVREFNKIFNYLKVTMKNYNDKVLSNNNVNPFSSESYDRIITKLSNIKSDQEYLKIIDSFMTSLHEGRAYLSSKSDEPDKIIPLCIQYKDGKYYVIKAVNQELENKEITMIDGIKIDKYILNFKGSYSFENGKMFIKNLIIPSESAKTISFGDEEITIEPMSSQDFNHEIIKRDNPYFNNIVFNIIDGIPYLRINSFSHKMLASKEKYNFLGSEITGPIEYLNAIADYLNSNNVSDLIIDIRGNKGGSDEWFSLLSMFSDKEYTHNYSVDSTIGRQSYGETNEIINGLGEDINTSLKRLQDGTSSLDCSVFIENGNSTIKNRYLLINSDNYSVCDTLSKFSNKTGFATTIGSHTSGDGFGVTPYSFTTDILRRNDAKLVIPSTFYNLEEFQTEPSIKTKEDLLMSYEYGTYKDNELKQAIEIVKSRKLEQENNISFQ